jgi:hypothetical protein
MSRLVVGQLQAADPVTHLVSVAAGDTVYSPGSVVQVVNTTIYTPTAISLNGASNFVNIPNLSATITPKSASSRIYVTSRWFGESNPQNTNWDTTFGLRRNGTIVGQNPSAGGLNGISMAALSYYADDGNSTPEMMYLDFWDTPATAAALTYQVYAASVNASTLFTNRTVGASGANFEYGSSTITLWEIAA